MERKLLVVKDLPACSEDTIINYLEIICDNGVEDIHFYDDRVKHIALVTMETDIEDFGSCQRKAKKRRIEGQEVTLEEVSPADGILVKELPPRITEDTLRFYFETTKAGGVDDAVTDSVIWKNLLVATVLFNDTNVVQRVLKKDLHKPQKNSPAVEITPYYHAFHEEVLQYLNSLQSSSASSSASSSLSGYTTEDTGSPLTTRRSEETWSSLTALNAEETKGLVTTPCTEGTWSSLISAETSSNPVESLDNGWHSPDVHCPWTSVLATPLTESTSAMKSLSRATSENMTMTSLTGAPHKGEHTFGASHPLQEPSRNQVKEVGQVRELVNCHEALLSNAAPADKLLPKPKLVSPHSPQEERRTSLDDVDLNHLIPDRIPEFKPYVPELAKHCEAPLSSSAPPEKPPKLKPPKPKPKPKPRPKPKPADVPEETIGKTSVTFPEAHVKLLQASRVENEFPRCKLTIKNGSITIEGPEYILQEVTLKLYEKNHSISASTHEVSVVIAEILLSKKGKSYLENELTVSGTSVCYVNGTSIHCVSFSESETGTMIKDLKKLIGQETVNLDQSHMHYLKSPEWKAMHDRIEKEMMVKVTHNAGKNKLTIDGLNGDVKLVKGELLGELKRHAHVAKQFEVSGVKGKCMKIIFQNNIAEIKKKLCSEGGGMDETSSVSSLKIKMEGTPKDVDDKIKRLKQLEEKVWHERLHLGKDVAKEKDLNLLVRGIQRSDPKAIVASFEAQHPNYFLELNLPLMKATPESTTASNGFEKLSRSYSLEKLNSSDGQVETIRVFDDHRTSSHFDHPITPPVPQATSIKVGNITVSVHKGDVTKEKSDVLVNVVSRSLTLGETAVSSAFMKSGGASFIQHFEMMKTRYVPGNVIQTPASGNLSTKKVFTIVLDKWSPPKSKTVFKALIDVSLKTADAASFTSIAFAAVGCGKLLRFPESFVASAIVSTIRNNSTLQNLKIVKLVLYDRQTYQKFLDEISPRHSMRHSITFADLEELHGTRPRQDISSSKSIMHSGTKITVQQGDITRFKATVLVNMVTGDLDLRSTAVSQAFTRAGGKPFVQDFEIAKSSPATTGIIVTSGGNLPCSYVYHVTLKKWHSGSRQEYTDIIRECFKLAEGYNTSSIAFPSLGCGVLLKYPPDFVASCLIDNAKASSVANVTFVVYDQPVLQIFMDQLTSGTSQAASNNDPHLESENYATLRHFAKFSREGRVPTAEAKTANVVIFGKDKKTCNDAKAALAKQLKEDFLHTQIIEHEDLLKLPKKSIESMQSTAKRNGIWIKFPNPDKRSKKDKPQLKLKGEKKCVLLVKVQVQDILLQTKKTEHKPKHTKEKRGTREFLAEMGSMTEFHTPSYWTQFKSTKSLADVLKGLFIQSPKSNHDLVKVDKTTYDAIDTLVQKTWDSTLVGQGKDALNLSHKAINVIDIQRLENPELFKRYCQKRSSRFTDAARIGHRCTPIEKLKGSQGPVKTSMQKIDILTKDMYSEVNEYYFFHGTKMDRLQAILTSGLDSRVGNTNAMFGSGVYGAESSTKADQYTDDKNARTTGSKQMMLMRMTLGEPFLTNDKNSPKYRRPPCQDPNHRAETCDKNHGQCHSVIGDGSWLFREFVVYEPELCYPEYIITYNRV
ncbi:uncharacterized protein [Haliotis asinina]|uniref:uncharacterized protein n=1 Tax=Haliotis asinina TaxID=109174 RepID=UPI003531F361